jgi:hypothetical protein
VPNGDGINIADAAESITEQAKAGIAKEKWG